jgi:hypothetical protein
MQTRASLDQNALDLRGRAADMPRQRSPRLLKQPRFLGASVEHPHPMGPAMRVDSARFHAAIVA